MAITWHTLIRQPRAGTFQEHALSEKDYPWISLPDPSMGLQGTLLDQVFLKLSFFFPTSCVGRSYMYIYTMSPPKPTEKERFWPPKKIIYHKTSKNLGLAGP